jgi:hypothetical protein
LLVADKARHPGKSGWKCLRQYPVTAAAHLRCEQGPACPSQAGAQQPPLLGMRRGHHQHHLLLLLQLWRLLLRLCGHSLPPLLLLLLSCAWPVVCPPA